jgi:hypothetical protein
MDMRRKVSLMAVGAAMGLVVTAAGGGRVFRAPQHSKPVVIGMVPLLAAPQEYDGKVVQTWGFLYLRFEDDSVWLHREDLLNFLWKDSFALDLTQKQREQFKSLNHTYVMVQGTLHSKGPDGPGLESGTISDVTMVHGWWPFVPFAPKKK